MDKKNFIFLIVLMALLIACIAMMGVSLLVKERTFGQVSGYLAIGAVVITLIGVVVIIRSNKHNMRNEELGIQNCHCEARRAVAISTDYLTTNH